MTQPTENKRPRRFLITHFSGKIRRPIADPDTPRPFVSRITPTARINHADISRPKARRSGRSAGHASDPRTPRNQALENVGEGYYRILVCHPPRLYSSQRIAGVKSLGSRILARRSNGRSGSSLLLRLRLVGWKTLSLARSGAPSCRLQARSGSTSRPSSRKMPPGPFQTNLAELGWSDSSGLINLLAVHFLKLKGRMQLTVRSLDQNISYCIQPSSLIPANEDLAEIPCDAKLAKSPYFSVTYGLKNCLSSSPLSPSAFVIPLHT